MNEIHIVAMYQLATMREDDRRTTEETVGRMYAGVARAIRRLRGARVKVRTGALQPETSAR